MLRGADSSPSLGGCAGVTAMPKTLKHPKTQTHPLYRRVGAWPELSMVVGGWATSPTERPSWHVEHASSAHPSPHTRVFTWHVLPRVPAGRDGDEDSRGNVIIARALITGVLAQGGQDSRRPGEGLHHAGNSEPRSYHHKCQVDYFNHIRSLLINMN